MRNREYDLNNKKLKTTMHLDGHKCNGHGDTEIEYGLMRKSKTTDISGRNVALLLY